MLTIHYLIQTTTPRSPEASTKRKNPEPNPECSPKKTARRETQAVVTEKAPESQRKGPKAPTICKPASPNPCSLRTDARKTKSGNYIITILYYNNYDAGSIWLQWTVVVKL